MKSKLSLSPIIFILTLVLVFPAGFASSEETPKGIKLGLDTAKAIAEQKDISAGIAAVAKDELSNWMWNSIGGYEKIVFQNTEADIPGVREKAKKIYEAIENVDKAATAVAEGKYDDALISSVDVVVGAADHPLVSTTWAAVKLTYESHKLVKASQAELEIETLYGMVNNDRRLLGKTDLKSDTPPEIPLNADTSDYFFDKYIMTNDSARQMMKSYVQKVLEEEWPEQSWGDYAKSWLAIGSGVDTARSAETEALATEWRQKGRTWTTQLLKDVNKQAKVAWAETRVRQQLAEFKVFYERAKIFYNNDIEQMLKEFLAIKEYQKNLPSYKLALEDSKKQRAVLDAAVGKFTSEQIKSVAAWLNSAEEWQLKLLGASSAAQIIREESLAASLSQERNQWMSLIDKINGLVHQEEPRIVEDVKQDIGLSAPDASWRWAGQVNAKSEQYYSLFANTLKPFDFNVVSVNVMVPGRKEAKNFNGTPEQIKAAVIDALNMGDFDLAKAIIDAWPSAVSAAIEKHFEPYQEALKNNVPPPELVAQSALVNQMTEQFTAASAPMWQNIQLLWQQHDAIVDAWIDPRGEKIVNQIVALQDQIWPIWAPLTEPSNQLYFMNAAWPNAYAKVIETYTRLNCPPSIVMNEMLKTLNEAYNAYNALRQAVAKQQAEYVVVMDAVEKDLPFTAIESPDRTKELLPIIDNSVIVSHVNTALAQVKANLHTFVPKVTNAGDQISVLPLILGQMAVKISDGIYPQAALNDLFSAVENSAAVWRAAAKRWLAVPALDSDDILKIRVLVDPAFDPAKRIQRLTVTAQGVSALISKVKSDINTLVQLAGTDGANREKDADWLQNKSKEVQAFINNQVNKGYFELGSNDYEVKFAPNRYEGMILVGQPFRHYMTSVELEAYATMLRGEWAKLPGYQFIQQYAPQQAQKLQTLLTFPGVKPAKEVNFILSGGTDPIYQSSIIAASKLVKSIDPKSDNYEKSMEQLALLLPETLSVPTVREQENIKNQAALLGMTVEDYNQKVRGVKQQQTLAVYQLRDNAGAEVDSSANPLAAGYQSVRKEIAVLINARLEYKINERQSQDQARYEAENKQAMDDLRKQQEAQNQENLRNTNPTDFYGWQVMDVRLNSYSVEGATGEILIEQDKLVDGKVRITARLNHIDGVKTMLISEDGGRSWKPLVLGTAIDHEMTPFPDRLYNPILQFITQEGLRANLSLLSPSTGFRYKAADRTNDIVATVQAISSAYERQDVSAFSELVSRDYLGNKTMLEEGVRFDFDMFLDIQLKLYINRIVENSGRYTVETKWDKSQTPRKTGQIQKTTGRTMITFMNEDGMLKVQNLRGDLIYATLSPDIAQASGLSTAKINEIRIAQAERNPVQPGAGTTEDAGGVTSSSSSVLIVLTSPVLVVPGFPGIGFDFTANAQVVASTANSDMDFEGSLIFPVQAQKINGTTFDALSTAPTSGYVAGNGINNDGTGAVYAFVTQEGYYGKLEVLSFDNNPGGNLRFKYVVQTDGTTNLATQ